MHDLYSESSLRASFVNVQLNEMNKPRLPCAVDFGASVIRNGLTLDLDSDHSARRSRVVSLSDLALEAMSPVYTNVTTDGTRTGTHTLMTPTPTQFLFPRSVTAEQEAYASGFALALEEIYRQNGDRPEVGDLQNSLSTDGRSNTTLGPMAYSCGVWQPAAVTHATTLQNIPGSSVRSAPSGVFGELPSAPKSHWSSTLDCRSNSLNSFQALPLPYVTPNVDVGHLMDTVPSQSDSLYSNLTGLRNVTSGAHCTGSRDVKGFSHTLNYIPMTSSLPVSCLSDTITAVPRKPADHSGMPTYFSSVNSNNSPQLPVHSSKQLLSSDLSSSTVTTTAPSLQLSVDMQQQDRWRLERKRAKNRVAAARCQTRKIERITKLENKARELRNYNAQLSQTAKLLHEQVAKLQKQILSHTERGCRLLIPAL